MGFELVGAWALTSAISYRDGVAKPIFGQPPAGQIQYTADGRMSAFLMDPDWAARGEATADTVTEFFAYGGRWRLHGDRVEHFVEFSSAPQRVGAEFVRILKILEPNTIRLETAPETSKSGAVYVTHLTWRRY